MKKRKLHIITFVVLSSLLCLPSQMIAKDRRTSSDAQNQAVQQAINIKGCITDKNGDPLIGVAVMIVGTKEGTFTDQDGTYNIEIPHMNTTLEISCLGYKTIRIKPEGKRILDIVLEDDIDTLDELIVVGYGTMKRKDLVGAVDQISSKSLEGRVTPTLARSLQGQIPNLNITFRDGKPDRAVQYNVRGATSVGAGGKALVLIDGVESSPNNINSEDIENISVLKDASSAAVYGARGAYGVVLITTKKANQGKVKVNYNGSVSINQRSNKPELITNGLQWTDNFVEAYVNNKGSLPTSINNFFPYTPEWHEELRRHDANPELPVVQINENTGKYEYFGNTNWDEILYKDFSIGTDHAISVNGGNDIVNFYVSGRFFMQDGIYRQNSDDFKRGNIRAKGSIQIRPWLSIDNNFDVMRKTYYYPLPSTNLTMTVSRNLEHQGFPIAVMYNPDGTLTYNAVYNSVGDFYNNKSHQKETTLQLRNTVGLNITPIKDVLRFRADFSYLNIAYQRMRSQNLITYSPAPDVLSEVGNSLLRIDKNETNYIAGNVNGTYTPRLGDNHSLTVMLGWNIEASQYDRSFSQRDGFLFDDKPNFDLMDGINYKLAMSDSNWSYVGFFYRLNYNYKSRYLIETSGRYDGSSKFPTKQKWGFFPSASVAWRISEEPFMSQAKGWMDNFKLRFSVGSLGNGNVSPYAYLPSMGISKTSVILGTNQQNYTSCPGLIPDSLTWETVTTYDVGIDLDLFQNRFNFVFDWYRRNTTDMYTPGPTLPETLGTGAPKGNYADMKTVGWEISLGWRDSFKLANSDFHYGLKFMLWDNNSWITKYNNETGKLSDYYEGYKLGTIWGYQIEGLFKDADDVARHADQSYIKISDSGIWQAGDLKFKDINGDGKIDKGAQTIDDHGDLTIIGNSMARLNYGFNIDLAWKGIGISAFFQGTGKRDWYIGQESGFFWGQYNRPYGYGLEMHEDRWTPENPDPNALWPRLVGYSAQNSDRPLGTPNDRFLQDISYLRLKSLSVEYSLPRKIINKIGMQNLKFFFTGENLFTCTKLCKNLDPEGVWGGDPDFNDKGQKEAGYGYPMLKTYTFGLNITF